MQICSFNYAGGWIVDSQGNYISQDIFACAELVASMRPDIICLQESLLSTTTSTAKDLANELEKLNGIQYEVWEISAAHRANHIDKSKELGMAILSRFHIEKKYNPIKYPYPKFKLRWKNGRFVARHDKWLMMAEIQGIIIGNTQMLPLHIWRHSYTEKDLDGASLGEKIQQVILSTFNMSKDIILCGDINVDDPQLIYSEMYAKLGLTDIIAKRDVTTIDGDHRDHILYSDGIALQTSSKFILKTDLFDHFPIGGNFVKKA